MTDKKPLNRRKFLTATATVASGVGLACAVTPFISSMQPSKRAKAAGLPTEVDISQLQYGQMITVEWRGRPIWVVRRNQQHLESLSQVVDLLKDPQSQESDQPDNSKNDFRSINPEFLVLVGVCTHLGCAPLFRPQANDPSLGEDWLGGFFCPCHGSKFDLSGRVYRGAPATTNLPVPPYRFSDNSTLIIGEEVSA